MPLVLKQARQPLASHTVSVPLSCGQPGGEQPYAPIRIRFNTAEECEHVYARRFRR